jgi:hypothetical protein
VTQGRYADPRAVRYLTDTLVARARKAARYWFERVTPLDDFVVGDDGALCFRDLLVAHGLTRDTATAMRYGARALDYAGRPVAWTPTLEAAPTGRGGACVRSLPAVADHDGYTIVELHVERPRGRRLAPVSVHVARAPQTGRLRVIGVRR